MAELLLELLSQEIPARMQDRACQDLARLVGEMLATAGVAFDQPIRSYATPRRLAIVATGLPLQQADRVVERKGPRVDAPEQARAGFLRGLAGIEHTLEERDEKKARMLYAVIREPGRAVANLLSELLPEAIRRLPWPKSMRWGDGDFRWVRPLQSILCLLDGRVVPFELGGVPAGATTRGHRFMAPEPFAAVDFADYVIQLRDAKVILDGAERRQIIARAVDELATGEGYVPTDDPALLDEVKGLVEWPVPLVGTIDAAFMKLPAEVLVGTMRANQKYLTLRTEDGRLAPRFVIVANNVASDGGAAIVAGNERVLRARLWDARFFWDQDCQTPLESRLPMLADMVYHASLGSVLERVQYLIPLTEYLCQFVPASDQALATRAARLSKCDLITGMVREFPELQGIMGAYYASEQSEPAPVARALAEQYTPKGPDDNYPKAPTSIILAIADRSLTLVGFFGRDIKPTGSKDPFALRRAALGCIRIITENGLRLPLRNVFRQAVQIYGLVLNDPPLPDPRGMARAKLGGLYGVDADTLASELLEFFADRLKGHLRDRGIRHDVVAAAFAVGAEDDLVRLIARAEALQAFLDSEDGRNLLAAYRRASSIVGIEEKKDDRSYNGHPVYGALVDPAEVDLHEALERAQGAIDLALQNEDYTQAMTALAGLRAPVDRFFETVMVNVPQPDLRVNRLLLLGRIRASLQLVADFALIEDAARPGT